MNMQSIMAQAQKMQKEIEKKKAEIDATVFDGKSEWVSVKFNGKRELVSFQITHPGNIEEDDKEILEDMISIAIKDALHKIDKAYEESLGGYGSSLNGMF